MAYDTDYANANDGPLQQRVRVAMVNTATLIAGEAPSSGFARDEKRHALAVSVLSDGGLKDLERFMFAAVAGGAVTPASSDAQIDTRLASIWNDLAGVNGREAAA